MSSTDSQQRPRGGVKHCSKCGKEFFAIRATHRYCSRECSLLVWKTARGIFTLKPIRFCRQCGKEFVRTSPNVRHCSLECSKKSARESRCKFYAKNPNKMAEYRKRTKERGTEAGGNMGRLRRRYPDLPKACQACGETRVLDAAHRPEFARKGAWRSAKNCTPDKIWILCPTCHALLDRMHYDPASLGLK